MKREAEFCDLCRVLVPEGHSRDRMPAVLHTTIEGKNVDIFTELYVVQRFEGAPKADLCDSCYDEARRQLMTAIQAVPV